MRSGERRGVAGLVRGSPALHSARDALNPLLAPALRIAAFDELKTMASAQ